MTGVTGLAELVSAAPDLRPTYLAPDLSGLAQPHQEPGGSGEEVSLGGWTAKVRDGALAINGAGEAADWWRVVAVAAWRELDATGEPVRTEGLAPPR
jgi:hypothetical protein